VSKIIALGISPAAGFTDELPTFELSSKAIGNPVLSPFGDLTGALQ